MQQLVQLHLLLTDLLRNKMKKDDLSKMNLEETFENIENIMEKLQSDELPIEDSFNLYKEGMELINHCNEVIDDVEKQIIILNSNSALGEE